MISNFAQGVNELPQNQLDKIFKHLDGLAQSCSGQPLAAFDADGTLWDSDVGEEFFDYQIQQRLLDLPENPWKVYKAKKQINPREAYLWLAQINEGQKISQIQAWAQDSFEKKPPAFFKSTIKLIEHLKSLQFEIFIVTASIKWAVEPGGLALGLDRDHVLGVKTHVVNERVTDQEDPPITWREGKALALKKYSSGTPLLCCGNTSGDVQLLRLSQGLALAFKTSHPGDSLFPSEQELQKEALIHGFLTHHYR